MIKPFGSVRNSLNTRSVEIGFGISVDKQVPMTDDVGGYVFGVVVIFELLVYRVMFGFDYFK